MWVKVNCLGFIPFMKNISEESSNNITIKLKGDPFLLSEVVVKGKYSGIRQRNDTISYDPKIFKDGSEITLGDLLNKLPGISVDGNGNVKAQGKDVSNLLINGIDHFSGNVQLATKNVSSEIVDKVEVINNYGEYSQIEGFKTSDKTAINIGVSKDKLGRITGDATVGGGLQDKFSSRINVMQILPQSMISFLGATNNSGDQIFSIDDYFQLKGGINEVMGKEGNFNISEEEQRLLYPPNNTYERTNGLGALNFSYQNNKSLKINSSLLFYDNQSKAEDYENYIFYLSNNDILQFSEISKSENKNILASGYTKIRYNIDSTLNISYNGNISKTNMEEKFNYISQDKKIINDNDYSKVKPLKTLHELMFMKSFGKKVFILDAKLQYERTPSLLNIMTDSLLLPISLIYKDGIALFQQDKNQKEINNTIYSSFLLPLNNKYYARFEVGFDNDYRELKTNANNCPKPIPNDSLINDLSINIRRYYNEIELVKNREFLQFKLGLVSSIYEQSSNKNIHIENSTFFRFSPKLDVSLKFNAKTKLKLNFSSLYYNNPIINFYDSFIINSYKSYRTESKTSSLMNHCYQVRSLYSYFDFFNGLSIVATAVYQRQKNTNTLNYEQNDIVTQSAYLQSKPRDAINFTISIDKKIGFIPWSISFVGLGSYSSFSNYISYDINNMRNTVFKADASIISKYDFPLNIELLYKNNRSLYESDSFDKIYQNIYEIGGKLKFKLSSKLYGDIQYVYVNNKVSSRIYETNVLNSMIKYSLSKKITILLQTNNILHLNNFDWQATSFYNNYQIDRQYRRIPGYAMISTNIRF
jgi:hypothetical protein